MRAEFRNTEKAQRSTRGEKKAEKRLNENRCKFENENVSRERQ
jgi:hypothetical protein